MITKIIFLSSLILLWVSNSRAQQPDSTLILANLVQEMLTNNPELQSYYHRWQASASRISPAGTLPDPVIGIGVMNLPVDNFSFNQEPMTGKQISLMQQFPFPGKQGTRQKIAEMESEKYRLNFLERQNGLIKDLKYAFFDLFYIDKALETNQINQALLKQTLQV
ncbi:MAG: TolC family protein, partial [bacterium]